MTVVNELMCEICGKIFSEPLSLPCGHSFCGGTCISSSEDSKHEVECPLCKHVTNISELTANEQLAEKVFQFKLQNPTILCTSCSSCSGACEECYLCFHCENYLCRDCIIMHREMYSSVLLSRFLTLRVRQNRLSKLLNSDRISQIDAFANTIATLQAAIETALSRAEICLDSIEELVTEKPFHDLPESPDLSLVVQSLEAEGAAAEQKDRIQNASKLIPDLPSKPWPASLIHRIHNIPPKAPLILPAATGKHPPQSDAPEPANERPAHAVAKSTCITFQVIGKASKTGHLQTGDLEKHFSQFGKIVKLHRYLNADNTPSTCGFVVFEKLAEAQAALSEKCHVLDKHHLKLASSRRVPSVSQSKQKVPSKPLTRQPKPSKRIFVFGLKSKDQISDAMLEEHFSQFGKVNKVLKPLTNGKPSGRAIVTFDSPKAAQKALAMPHQNLLTSDLQVFAKFPALSKQLFRSSNSDKGT